MWQTVQTTFLAPALKAHNHSGGSCPSLLNSLYDRSTQTGSTRPVPLRDQTQRGWPWMGREPIAPCSWNRAAMNWGTVQHVGHLCVPQSQTTFWGYQDERQLLLHHNGLMYQAKIMVSDSDDMNRWRSAVYCSFHNEKVPTSRDWLEGHTHNFHSGDQSLCPIWNEEPPVIFLS